MRNISLTMPVGEMRQTYTPERTVLPAERGADGFENPQHRTCNAFHLNKTKAVIDGRVLRVLR